MFSWLKRLFRREPSRPVYLRDTEFLCWVCQKACPHAEGISLTDPQSARDRTSHVCPRCWDSIPPGERVAIMRMLRPKDLGGIGLVEEMAENNKISRRIDAAVMEDLDDISKGEEWKKGYDTSADDRDEQPRPPISDDDLRPLIDQQLYDRPKKRRAKKPPRKPPEQKPQTLDDILDDDTDHFQQGT